MALNFDPSDSARVGDVIAVQTERLVVRLDPGTAGFVKGTSAGVLPIGTVNSYITVPVGGQRAVALVTGVRLAEEPPSRAGSDVLRFLDAVLVGRFETGSFRRGLAAYPSIGAPASVASPAELASIFATVGSYSLDLGEAVIAPELRVALDANTLLARHCAVLGSTGSGKSCSVTAILDGLFDLQITSPHIVIFDSNGEYATAFAAGTERAKRANAVVLGPQLGPKGGFVLPHWFMDNEDHLGLFRAGEGAQAPLLQRAIADARLARDSGEALPEILSLAGLVRDIRTILATNPGRKPQEVLANALRELEANAKAIQEAHATAGHDDDVKRWAGISGISSGWQVLRLKTGNEGWDEPPTLAQRNGIQSLLDQVEVVIRGTIDSAGLGSATAAADFDAPRYYSLQELHDYFLPRRVGMAAQDDFRIRGYVSTLIVRISRLLADSRYDFMTRVERFPRALEYYLRLLLGVDPLAGDSGEVPWAASYRSRAGASMSHSVTVLDLSMVAYDVLENTAALLARLLFGFAQRVEPRGTFPMLIVLEEAHRYIPEMDHDRRLRSTVAFERIAKEGRKYGVSLLIASQRPREVSGTVLAQCGTLVAHRLGNAEDQEYLRQCTSFTGRDILRQLPDLATQHAVVLGESVPIPTHVRIRDVANPPRSSDPDFIGAWRGPQSGLGPAIERVAAEWEAGLLGQGSGGAGPEDPEFDSNSTQT